MTGLYIKGERELFASQWTQEEIRIAEVRVLTIEEKPEERTSQEKHLQEEGMPREQMQQRGIQREQMQQGGIAREQMQGEPSQGTDFQEKHQQQREVPEEYQQKQQTTDILLSQRLALTYSTISQLLLQAFFTFFSPFFALCIHHPVFRSVSGDVLTFLPPFLR